MLQQIAINFDRLPVVDPAVYKAIAWNQGVDTSNWGNQFTLRQGKLPGTGTVLLQDAQFRKLTSPSQYRHLLSFSDGTRTQTISRLAIVRTEAIDLGKNIPGLAPNAQTIHLLYLADARYSASSIFEKPQNVRSVFSPDLQPQNAEVVLRALYKPLQPLLRSLQFSPGTKTVSAQEPEIWNVRAHGRNAWDVFIDTVHELGWEFCIDATGRPWVVNPKETPEKATLDLIRLAELKFEAPAEAPQVSVPIPEAVRVVCPKLDFQWWKGTEKEETGEDRFFSEPIHSSKHPIQGYLESQEHGRIITGTEKIVYSSVPLLISDMGQEINKDAVERQHKNLVRRFAKVLGQPEMDRRFYGIWEFDFSEGYLSELTFSDVQVDALTTGIRKRPCLPQAEWGDPKVDMLSTSVPYARSGIVEISSGGSEPDQWTTVTFLYGQVSITGVIWNKAQTDTAINATGKTLESGTRCKADWFYQLGVGGAWVLTGVLTKDEEAKDICDTLTKYTSFDKYQWQLFGHKKDEFCSWFTICDVMKSLPGYDAGTVGDSPGNTTLPVDDQYFVIQPDGECKMKLFDTCARLKKLAKLKPTSKKRQYLTVSPYIPGSGSPDSPGYVSEDLGLKCEWFVLDPCTLLKEIGGFNKEIRQIPAHITGICTWVTVCEMLRLFVPGHSPGQTQVIKHLSGSDECTWATEEGGGGSTNVCDQVMAYPTYSSGTPQMFVHYASGSCVWATFCDFVKVSVAWVTGPNRKYLSINTSGVCQALDFDICTELKTINGYDSSLSNNRDQFVSIKQGVCKVGALDLCEELKLLVGYNNSPSFTPRQYVSITGASCQVGPLDLCAEIKRLTGYSDSSSRRQFVSVTSGNCQVAELNLCSELILLTGHNQSTKQFVGHDAGSPICKWVDADANNQINLCAEIKLLTGYDSSPSNTRRQFVSVTGTVCQVAPLDLCGEIQLLNGYSSGSTRRQFVSITSGTCQVNPLDICAELILLTGHSQAAKQFVGHDAGSSVCKWVSAPLDLCDEIKLLSGYSSVSTRRLFVSVTTGNCQVGPLDLCAEIKLLSGYSSVSTRRQFVSVTSGNCQVAELDLCSEMNLITGRNQSIEQVLGHDAGSAVCKWKPMPSGGGTVDCNALKAVFSPPLTGTWAMGFVNGQCTLIEIHTC